MRPTAALLVLGWLGSSVAAPPYPLVASQMAILRDGAREALRSSCGRCHDGTLRSAKPAALKIFDLHETDWSARMTDVQMGHMVGRFDGFKMPQVNRDRVQAFLDAELARRAGASPAQTDASR
jgi:cytochrome c553